MNINRFKEVLDYEPDTGIFTWKVIRRGGARKNRIAGGLWNKKYVVIGLDGHCYLAHRLAWLFHYGIWPTGIIDHKDGDTRNNRISNLREASKSENAFNCRKYASSRSPYKGITYKSKVRKWMASIRVDGKRMHLGYFGTPEEAHEAYLVAARKYRGEFARAA